MWLDKGMAKVGGVRIMSLSLYRDIIRTIENNKARECQGMLESKYPEVPPMTLGSVLSTYVQRRMKANHGKHNTQENILKYYQRFQDGVKRNEAVGIILRLSDDIGITPVLTARFILEGYLRNLQEQYTKMQEKEEGQGQVDDDHHQCQHQIEHCVGQDTPELPQRQVPYNFGNIRSEITRLLRNTSLIEDRHLAYEVYLCLVQDSQYGPLPDVIKRTVGSEHETMLKEKLDEQNISYYDEKQLRTLGYDKTPDFKLDVPIAIEGRVVNWIESKATFGDEDTHQQYLNDQLISYFNRFGPGLVIYWLGYVETLESKTPKGIGVKDHLPTNITKPDPSSLHQYPLMVTPPHNDNEKTCPPKSESESRRAQNNIDF